MADPERIDLKNIELFGKQLCTLKQDFFDVIHPIGEVYTQYPQQDDPMTLYNKNGITSVWEEQLQYNGAFFRSSNALNVVWKIDGESNYYTIDNTNKVTPVKVKADTGGAINIASSSSGHTKTISGKTYKDYAVTGYSTAAAAYINKTNNLNIQGNQNQYHNHSFTPEGSISIKTNPTFTGSAVTSGANNRGHSHTINHGHSIKTANAYVHTNSGQASGPAIDWTTFASNTWESGKLDIALHDYSGSSGDESQNHTHTVTASGSISGGAYTFKGTESNTGYNGNSSVKESRPDNYSYIIWKRIA